MNVYKKNTLLHLLRYFSRWSIFILCGLPYVLFAQNLLFNGNFEEGLCYEEKKDHTIGGLNSKTGWLNCDELDLINPTCNDVCWHQNVPVNAPNRMGVKHTFWDIHDTMILFNCGCGYRCHNNSKSANFFFTPPFSNSHRNVLFGANMPPYSEGLQGIYANVAQRLSDPLIPNHHYYASVFYLPDYKGFFPKSPNLPDSTYFWNSIHRPGKPLSHNAFGLSFSTYALMEREMLPNINGFLRPYFLKTDTHQQKLRFWLNRDTLWQKWEGTFMADSAYRYMTFGNFWPTKDIDFQPPDFSIQNPGAQNISQIALDSFVLWDVTVTIIPDSALCAGKNTIIHSESYSRGITTWFNEHGEALGQGESLSIFLHQDTTLIARRYFPEIDVYFSDTAFIPIIRRKPDMTLSRIDADTCQLPAVFQASPSNISYTWNGETTPTNHTYTMQDSGTVILIGTEGNGCIDTLYYNVFPPVVFTAAWISDTCDDVHLIEINPDIYDFFINGATQSAPYSSHTAGRIAIVGVGENGCSDTVYLNIPLCIFPSEQSAYFPNAFSPNQDVLNPTFGPVGTYIVQYQMEIFNRWGELLYRTEDGTPWNGMYQNSPAQEGVYVYKINLTLQNGQTLNKMGTFHLLR